jgi:hypothetical protein
MTKNLQYPEAIVMARSAMKQSNDSKGLGFLDAGKFTIGWTGEVNGEGSLVTEGCSPTRHELVELAKYWHLVRLDLAYERFCYPDDGIGTGDHNRYVFAARRLNRLEAVLGKEAADMALASAEKDFSKNIPSEAWAAFKNGDSQ